MAFVLGFDIPVLEFLMVLNVMMLFYIILSMFEIRNLIKLNKEMESLIKGAKPTESITYTKQTSNYTPESESIEQSKSQ